MTRSSPKKERLIPTSRTDPRSLGRAASSAREMMDTPTPRDKELNQRIIDLENERERQARTIEALLEENADLKEDETTGLLLRKPFKMELNERLKDPIEHATVVMIDLKSMKWINDQFTHAGGDDFLKEAADRISDIFSARIDQPLFARWGGDEFLIFIPNPSQEEGDELEDYLSYLFNDHENDDYGCWIPIGDQEALLRGRFTVKEMRNGTLDPDGVVKTCNEMDKELTHMALEENDRGKPTPVRPTTVR